jgi:hypothetical protein
MLDAFLISSCCKSVSIFPFWPTASSLVMFSVVVSCCISLCVSPLYQILLIGTPLICVPLHPFPFAFHSFFDFRMHPGFLLFTLKKSEGKLFMGGLLWLSLGCGFF